MENDYVILYEAASDEEADDVLQLLLDKKFDCIKVNDSGGFDGILGVSGSPKITIQIIRSQVTEAKYFLASLEGEAPEEYYLNDFTNEELLNILKEESAWSIGDVTLAKDILSKRGVDWNKEELKKASVIYEEKKDEPEKIKDIILILGFLSAVLGGILGILIGYFIMSLKKVNRKGERVYYYDENSRFWGGVIFYTGIFVLVFFIRDFFFNENYYLDSLF